MYHVLIYVVFPIAAIAPRPAESLMPPPPAPAVVANQTPASAGAPPPSGTVTRSNVVKEVERLEKNREERRARQAEIKEEKKALMNMDPGNPNWETLSMIK